MSGTPADETSQGADPVGPRAWIAVSALFLVCFWPLLAVRFHYYLEQPLYSHCVLLPVVSALWIYDRWGALRAIPRSVSGRGAACLAACASLYVFGRLSHSNLYQHVAMLGAAGAVVWTLAGAPLLRALAFPLGYLALMVPLRKTWDDAITVPLQGFATSIAESCFNAFGWIVVRDGNVLQLPGTKLLVEERCSGAHSLYALVALAIAWTAFVERPWWLRITVVAATLPVAVAANAVRVTVTGVLAYKVDPKYAQGVSHTTAGLIVFVIGLALLLGLDWLLKPGPRASGDHAARPA